jgi:hypothetical protein
MRLALSQAVFGRLDACAGITRPSNFNTPEKYILGCLAAQDRNEGEVVCLGYRQSSSSLDIERKRQVTDDPKTLGLAEVRSLHPSHCCENGGRRALANT